MTRNHWRRRAALILASAAIGSLVVSSGAAADDPTAGWLTSGNGARNQRNQPAESVVTTANVASLAPRWSSTAAGEITATPTVQSGVVYASDHGGRVTASSTATGLVTWITNLSAGANPEVPLTSPVIAGGSLLVGTDHGRVIALDRATGAILWATVANQGPLAAITQSPIVDKGVVYVGVDSTEDLAAANPGAACCSFRGTVSALDLATGAIRWTTYLVPDGFAGAPVSGGAPVLDTKSGTLYVTTGHNFWAPQATLDCFAATPGSISCQEPANLADSVVALEPATGAVKWTTRAAVGDIWNFDCLADYGDGSLCPNVGGSGQGFAGGAMLVKAKTKAGKPQDVLVAGQKSGRIWELSPATGAVRWFTTVGPGGLLGGAGLGAATDDKRIYFSVANVEGQPYSATGLGTGGSWGAIDPLTGAILWQTKDPNGAPDPGAVSVANGVVYGGSLGTGAGSATMVALDAKTGATLWTYVADGSVVDGPSVVDGVVYWGSGYSFLGHGTTGSTLYAFSLNGQ